MFLVIDQKLQHCQTFRSTGCQLEATEDWDTPSDSHGVNETFRRSRQISSRLKFSTQNLATLENSDKQTESYCSRGKNTFYPDSMSTNNLIW